MAHLSKTPQNMSSIGAVCNSLGKTSLTSLVGYFWATDGFHPDELVPSEGRVYNLSFGLN